MSSGVPQSSKIFVSCSGCRNSITSQGDTVVTRSQTMMENYYRKITNELKQRVTKQGIT
jgi:hypothetical protein